LLPTEPRISTDAYRHLWDGRVQTAGINPYLYAPEAEALWPLRDDAVYRWINRKEFPTVYPAGAQLVLWSLAELGVTTLTRFKTFLLLADLGSLVLLLQLLDHYQVNRLRILLYAWNPLTVFESAHAGHLEAVTVFFILAALLLFVKQRVNLAFASLALATSLKLYPALLAAVLARGQVVRCILIFTTVLLGTYVPYLDAGKKIIGFLPVYFSEPDEITNIGLPSLLFTILHPVQAGWVLRLMVLVVAVWLFVRRGEGALSLLRQVYLLMSVHTLLLYPALYPWYLCWLIPLLCFFPSPGWLYFSCASAFVYLTWPTPTWVLWLEYVPLYILLGTEMMRKRSGNL
jgi:predicted DNA-binding transcriptional regulator AlpA